MVVNQVNGQKMITLNDEKIGERAGIIALQIHSGGGIKIKWRKLKVKSS